MAANKIHTVNFDYGVDRTESLELRKKIMVIGQVICFVLIVKHVYHVPEIKNNHDIVKVTYTGKLRNRSTSEVLNTRTEVMIQVPSGIQASDCAFSFCFLKALQTTLMYGQG